MYQRSYAESLESSPGECRERERRALDHALQLLEKARHDGVGSAAAAEALHFLCRLWKALIEDLISPENDLPDVLRGDLVSVGIWVLREADSIREEKSSNFRGLIEICSAIRNGLR
ncbi:flagellar FlaF family protein [Methylocella silvestris BL2]|uniref:Flagellar FlaF family protein n=2 Tax=Methylocella silvestris TaxID=199596 RepID=B8EL33_METSB|nr:flagellar FlaF family protein [Methylocella silvestris BL2]